MPGHDIVVVGASAGGVEALETLVRTLPPGLPAAIFVVLHIPAHSPSFVPVILSRSGLLETVLASDGMEIKHGRIYVAPPDHHMLVERGIVRVVRGPKENRHRPAIDPLFRSAALAYGPQVVGVILTGTLDDGTAGLQAVKRRGGIAIVQDPDEAFYPGMPLSALQHVQVDYTLPLAAIGQLLVRLASEPVKEEAGDPMSKDLEKEAQKAQMDTTLMGADEQDGTPSVFSCPECGGVLWEMQDGEILRFRCRVGHAFSTESMFAQQSEALETALSVTLKTLQESADLSRRMAQQAHLRGQKRLASRFEAKLQEAEQRIALIKRALIKSETFANDERPASEQRPDKTG